MRIIVKGSDQFGTIILATAFNTGAVQECLLVTNGFCFICLRKIVNEGGNPPPPPHSLTWIEHHLGVDLKKTLLQSENLTDKGPHPFLRLLMEKMVNFQVDLCGDCLSPAEVLSRLPKQSGKFGEELKVQTALDAIQNKIEEADMSGRMEEYYEQLKCPQENIREAALTSVGRLLRAEIVEKCKARLNDEQRPNVTPDLDQTANVRITTRSRSRQHIQISQSNENGSPTATSRQTSQILAASPHSSVTPELSQLVERPVLEKSDCIFCLLPTRHLNKLEAHLRVHTDEKPFFCLECDEAFKTMDKLKRHNNTHNPFRERQFQCGLCPLAFFTKTACQRHQAGHSGNRPFCCESCPQAFKRNDQLISHRKSVHTTRVHDK